MQYCFQCLANALLDAHLLGDITERTDNANLLLHAIKQRSDVHFYNTFSAIGTLNTDSLCPNPLTTQSARKWKVIAGNWLSMQCISRVALQDLIQPVLRVHIFTQKRGRGIIT